MITKMKNEQLNKSKTFKYFYNQYDWQRVIVSQLTELNQEHFFY
jgi:hypothetical protein